MPDIREIVAAEVNEALQAKLPELFEQLREELSTIFDTKIAAVTFNQGGGNTHRNFMACNPPKFEGHKDPIACSRWILDIEGAFRTSACPAALQTLYSTNLLQGPAKYWWSLERSTLGAQIADNLSWDEFKARLTHQFAPPIEVEQLRKGFLNLKQTTESVNEITDKFLEQSVFCQEYVATEEMKLFRFCEMLRPDIRTFVTTSRCKTMAEALEIARAAEIEMDRKRKQPPTHEASSSNKMFKPSESYKGKLPKCEECGRHHKGKCQEPYCYNCNKKGHLSQDCWSKSTSKICFHCKQMGHLRPDCPLLPENKVQAPATSTLRIKDAESMKKKNETTSVRVQAFQLTMKEEDEEPKEVADA